MHTTKSLKDIYIYIYIYIYISYFHTIKIQKYMLACILALIISLLK